VTERLINDEVRDDVLRLFEAARDGGGTPYEADRFLAYLTVPAAKSGRNVADTFAGRRRLVRFLHAVQLELGVCFTNEEWDRGLGLDAFVVLVAGKRLKPEHALRFAKQRLREARAHLVAEPVKFALFAAPLLVGAALASNVAIRLLLAVFWAAIPAGIAMVTTREYRYAQQLVARLEAKGSKTRRV
jgi:hypothetical protein